MTVEKEPGGAVRAPVPLAGRAGYLPAANGAAGQPHFYAQVQFCKACDVSPWRYLDDVLTRIMSDPVRRLKS